MNREELIERIKAVRNDGYLSATYLGNEHVGDLMGDILDALEQGEPTDALPLDPKPWLFISDQVFGEFRSDHDKGYHDVSGTYWVFSPREGFEKDRARYAAATQ